MVAILAMIYRISHDPRIGSGGIKFRGSRTQLASSCLSRKLLGQPDQCDQPLAFVGNTSSMAFAFRILQ
jgi:hypothetical protein